MAAAFWLMIFGAIYYALKYMFQRVALKKSSNEILLEELEKKCAELVSSSNIFKSEKQFRKELDAYHDEISSLKLIVEKEKGETNLDVRTKARVDENNKYNVMDKQANSNKNEFEYSPEDPSLDKRWSVAIKYQPELIGLASKLSIISPELSCQFKSKLIESKNFENASSVSDEVFMDYLDKNFGPNETVIIFAKKIIVDGFNDAAEELKQAVNVFGGDIDAEFIIDKIQRDFSLYYYNDESNNQRVEEGRTKQHVAKAVNENKEQKERKKRIDVSLKPQVRIRKSLEEAFTEKNWTRISIEELKKLTDTEQLAQLRNFLLSYEKKETPLHSAVWECKYDLAKLLLDFGFDPYKLNKDKNDVLDLSAGDPEIRLLVSGYKDPEMLKNIID